jgi:dynein light intermediate chain 1
MKPEQLENTIFAIWLDLTKPWTFLDQLSIWSDVLFAINKELFSKQLPLQKQNKMRKNIENHFKFYVNPDKDQQTQAENQEGEGDTEEFKQAIDEMDLEEGVLTVNLGIPIMLICTKSEVVATGETIKYFNPRFDFILKHLREFTLRYGATLFFTSARKGTNLEVLHEYLRHRYFEDSLSTGPEINNKESIFIPAGYDSPKFVEQLWPNIDDPYDKIVNNISGLLQDDDQEEVDCEEWDLWLDKMKENYKDDEEEDDTKAISKEQMEEKVKQKTIKPNEFYANLLKNKVNNARASVSKPADGEESTKVSDEEKQKKLAEFKKKLKLDNLE